MTRPMTISDLLKITISNLNTFINSKNDTEHRRHERITAVWTRTLGLFTIVLAILSAITAVILYQTNETTRQTQRAALYIKGIATTVAPTINRGPPQLVFVAQWANGGTTGTRDLRYRTMCGGESCLGKTLNGSNILIKAKLRGPKDILVQVPSKTYISVQGLRHT